MSTPKVAPCRQITAFGPSIGTYQERDIPAWIESGDGKRHEYVGVSGLCADLALLSPRQSVISPGLIYEEINFGEKNE